MELSNYQKNIKIQKLLNAKNVSIYDYKKMMMNYLLHRIALNPKTKPISDAVANINDINVQLQVLERISVLTKDGEVVLRPFSYNFTDKLKAYKKGKPEQVSYMPEANDFPKSAWDAFKVYHKTMDSVHEQSSALAYALTLDKKTRNLAMAINNLTGISKKKIMGILLDEDFNFISASEIKFARANHRLYTFGGRIKRAIKSDENIGVVIDEYCRLSDSYFCPKDFGKWMQTQGAIDIYEFKSKGKDLNKNSMSVLNFAKRCFLHKQSRERN